MPRMSPIVHCQEQHDGVVCPNNSVEAPQVGNCARPHRAHGRTNFRKGGWGDFGAPRAGKSPLAPLCKGGNGACHRKLSLRCGALTASVGRGRATAAYVEPTRCPACPPASPVGPAFGTMPLARRAY
jgi:hypothetical protein